MRPVEKGARTPDQYLGVEARGAYDAFIDVEARKAAGTPKTAHFHTTEAGKAIKLITKKKHQDIVDEIIRQTPLQKVIWPINRWVHQERAHTSEYQDAKERLTATIGEYCSFCERPVLSKLDIEHRVPKDVYADRKFAWENFLLACGNCNSVKGTKHKVLLLQGGALWEETNPATYCYWPDTLTPERTGNYAHDSYNVLLYQELGIVGINPKVPDGPTRDRVLATIAMVGLDRVLDTTPNTVSHLAYRTNANNSPATTWEDVEVSGDAPSGTLMQALNLALTPLARITVGRDRTALVGKYSSALRGEIECKDYRALHRAEAWQKAESARGYFDKLLVGNWKTGEPEKLSYRDFEVRLAQLTEAVVNLALATGLWSVWITVFKARPASDDFKLRPPIVPVLRRLIAMFPGTRPNSDFAPRIYTRWDEGAWLGELKAKESQQEVEDETKLDQQIERMDLEDDVAELKERVKRLERAKDHLERDLDKEEMLSRRYRRERDEADYHVDRLRDERDRADHERRTAERNLYHADNDNRLLVYQRDTALDQRDRARRERDDLQDEVYELRGEGMRY